LLQDYDEGIRTHFAFACARGREIFNKEGSKCLKIGDFIEYGLEKKIRLN